MPTKEEIDKMKQQGMSDSEIVRRFQDQGSYPKEINEAVDQTQVTPASPQGYGGMEPSLMPNRTEEIPNFPEAPVPQASYSQPSAPEPPTPYPQEQAPYPVQAAPQYEEDYDYQQYPEYDQYGYDQGYGQYPEYEYSQPNTEMMTDMTEHLINEKTEKLQKKILEIVKFKTEAQGKIENMNERLRRIENTIDTLQTAILGKIGEYARNISNLKSEVEATQESFSKAISVKQNIRELKKISSGKDHKTYKTTKKTKSRKKK